MQQQLNRGKPFDQSPSSTISTVEATFHYIPTDFQFPANDSLVQEKPSNIEESIHTLIVGRSSFSMDVHFKAKSAISKRISIG